MVATRSTRLLETSFDFGSPNHDCSGSPLPAVPATYRSVHANAPLAASGTGDRFCRQVSLSKRTLARSGEAAPGLWDPKGRAGPVGFIGSSGPRARRWLSPVARRTRQLAYF